MAQIKKQVVAEAILRAARALFRERGYSRTSMAEIARASNISTSNIYVYYFSKLDILFAIYEPWLEERLDELEHELCEIAGPRDRLLRILETFWRDLPAAENGLANNAMQALTTALPEERCNPALLNSALGRLLRMIRASLPEERIHLADDPHLAEIIFMAFDGYAMNHQLRRADDGAQAGGATQFMASLLLGESAERTQSTGYARALGSG
ncbi:TetR/AcrR family transcriptional regulator [Amorphus sp. MBR-141]